MEMVCVLLTLACSLIAFCASWQTLYQAIPNRGVIRLCVKCILCFIGSTCVALAYLNLFMAVFQWLGLVTLDAPPLGFVANVLLFFGLHLPSCLFSWSFSTTSSHRMKSENESQGRPNMHDVVWTAEAYISRSLGGKRAVVRRARKGWEGHQD